MSAVLLAAVADTLAEVAREHRRGIEPWEPWCKCGFDDGGYWEHLHALQAERVVARLTELLPGLPEQYRRASITLPPVNRLLEATLDGSPPVPLVDSPPVAEGGE